MRHWKHFAENDQSRGFATAVSANTKSDKGYGHILSFSNPMSRHRLSAKEKYYRPNFQKSHSSYNKLNEKMRFSLKHTQFARNLVTWKIST